MEHPSYLFFNFHCVNCHYKHFWYLLKYVHTHTHTQLFGCRKAKWTLCSFPTVPSFLEGIQTGFKGLTKAILPKLHLTYLNRLSLGLRAPRRSALTPYIIEHNRAPFPRCLKSFPLNPPGRLFVSRIATRGEQRQQRKTSALPSAPLLTRSHHRHAAWTYSHFHTTSINLSPCTLHVWLIASLEQNTHTHTHTHI